MGWHVALDVSLRSTSTHVLDEAGQCVWLGKRATNPEARATVVRKRAPGVVRVGLETGFLSTRLCNATHAWSKDAVRMPTRDHPGMAVTAVALWHRHLRRSPVDPARVVAKRDGAAGRRPDA